MFVSLYLTSKTLLLLLSFFWEEEEAAFCSENMVGTYGAVRRH